jgi:hypothetical protein
LYDEQIGTCSEISAVVYSSRSAVIGSTRAARQAGINVESKVTTGNTKAVIAKISGSTGLTCNSLLRFKVHRGALLKSPEGLPYFNQPRRGSWRFSSLFAIFIYPPEEQLNGNNCINQSFLLQFAECVATPEQHPNCIQRLIVRQLFVVVPAVLFSSSSVPVYSSPI